MIYILLLLIGLFLLQQVRTTLNSQYNKYASPVIYNDSIKDDVKYFIIYVFLDKQKSLNVSNIEFLKSLTNSLLCYYSAKIEMKEDLEYGEKC